MKIYLTKWLPSRLDFLATMSVEEAELMKQHGEWQNGLREQGLIIAHGPVIDPAGSYGVAIWEIADDVDIASLTARDPIFQAGIGHYEHYVMPQVKVRV